MILDLSSVAVFCRFDAASVPVRLYTTFKCIWGDANFFIWVDLLCAVLISRSCSVRYAMRALDVSRGASVHLYMLVHASAVDITWKVTL